MRLVGLEMSRTLPPGQHLWCSSDRYILEDTLETLLVFLFIERYNKGASTDIQKLFNRFIKRSIYANFTKS